MDPSQVKIPSLKDLNTENITENTILVNSSCEDVRMKYLMERLVSHLHNFARETRLSTAEWMAGIHFLTAVGKMCNDVHQEFILLSDILGFSFLVDAINHPKPQYATEGTVLGPFHTHDAKDIAHGEKMSSDPDGEPLLVLCTLKDSASRPIEGCKIDIWEADSTGHYDVQHSSRSGPDGRCVMYSDHDGMFWLKAIKPVPYPIPHEGPVGKLLQKLNRHPYRPSHMHFMFEKPGYDTLITALYPRGDPYEASDAVFGVKTSLVFDYSQVDRATAEKYGVEEGTWLMKYDFVLVSEDEARNLRDLKSKEAVEGLGLKVRFLEGLPVPDLD